MCWCVLCNPDYKPPKPGWDVTVCPKHVEEIVRKVVGEELEKFRLDLMRELGSKIR